MKVFLEEQRFTQWWLYLIILLPILFLLPKFKLNDKIEHVSSLIISLIVLMLIFLLFILIRLRTRIDEKGVYYRFVPFQFNEKFISWKDISKCYVRKYKPLVEYGGWGFKGGMFWNANKGMAFNIKGDIGLQLHLKNGKKILIGTQKENEINSVIQTYSQKINNHEN